MSRPLYNVLVESKNRTDVLQYRSQYNARNHYPSIINISGNIYYCAFTHYGEEGEDVQPSEIFAKISYDGMLSWTDEFKIMSIRAGKSGVVCPNLYKKGNGNLICITLERNDDLTWYGQIYQYESTDNGLTWDVGTLIYESSDYQTNDYLWISSNSILITQTGRLVLPLMVETTTTTHLTNNMVTVARHLYSDDEGTTWNLSETILQVAASGNDALIGSGHAVQLSDGTIVEEFRTRSRYGVITTSIDNGTTWTAASKKTSLIQSNADTYTFNINDTIYCIISRPDASVPQLTSADTRLYLDLYKSEDKGANWTFVKNLLYDSGVHDYTEPICYNTGSAIIMFYSYYPYNTTLQNLRFKRYIYTDLT